MAAIRRLNGRSAPSVVKEQIGLHPVGQEMVIRLATVADDIHQWGVAPAERDRQLRAFWPTEPMLASAMFSTVGRYAAFGWTLDGPPRTTSIVQRLFHGFEHGQGWITWVSKMLIDLFTQDNGAFSEVVRTSDDPTAPVISLNHLDANRCVRTGRWDEPVIYYDINNVGHLLKWYQVLMVTEFPSPIESMRGMQYCTVTRLLRAAQVMRDISIYKREKISGRFTRAIHLVGGVQARTIRDQIDIAKSEADNQGLTRYLQPVIVAALDPTSRVSKETIELASLPDGFDEEIAMRWYIAQLALAFGGDYQDYAPLPGGNLGTAQQSQTLHMKARGKGPKLFMSLVESAFNFQGIMPSNVTFTFGDQDVQEDIAHASLRIERAKERQIRIQSGEITPEVARQIAVDMGDLDEAYMKMLGQDDLTKDQILSGTQPPAGG